MLNVATKSSCSTGCGGKTWAASSTSSCSAVVLLDERKITIKLEPAARKWLAERGYDPAYGARPLKRVIQKQLQDPLAELILSGKVKDGDQVKVSTGKGSLTFNGKTPQASDVEEFEST